MEPKMSAYEKRMQKRREKAQAYFERKENSKKGFFKSLKAIPSKLWTALIAKKAKKS